MKTYIVLLLIFLGVAVSTALHHKRYKDEQGDIDRLQLALANAKSIIQPKVPISLETNPPNNELISYARFVMAPVVISKNSAEIILNISLQDSSLTSSANQELLWEHEDDKYHYSLTGSH